MCLYSYSTTRTSVPLSWSLVFIASDGMLMVLYKVISFSLSIKNNAKKNIYDASKNITKYNSGSKYTE